MNYSLKVKILQIAIELNLRESQVTKYYKEYWKLKGLYKLYLVYEEIKDDITHFLKLHRLSKTEGMSTEHVVNLLRIANNDLPALEDKYEKLRQSVDHLESKELDLSITLEELKSQIQNTKQMLNSCSIDTMSKKPKWACASCGMFSSRRYSVKRHIQSVHSGGAFLVSFIDYLVGRQAGYYLPSFPPTYETKTEHSNIGYQKIIKEETLRGIIRKNLQAQ